MDFKPKIPITVAMTTVVIKIICLINLLFIFIVSLHANPTNSPMTMLPTAHQGKPRNPLINKQYKQTPSVPTVIPLTGPK